MKITQKIPVKGKSFSVNRETETPKSKLVKYSENAQSRQPALDLLNYPIFKESEITYYNL